MSCDGSACVQSAADRILNDAACAPGASHSALCLRTGLHMIHPTPMVGHDDRKPQLSRLCSRSACTGRPNNASRTAPLQQPFGTALLRPSPRKLPQIPHQSPRSPHRGPCQAWKLLQNLSQPQNPPWKRLQSLSLLHRRELLVSMCRAALLRLEQLLWICCARESAVIHHSEAEVVAHLTLPVCAMSTVAIDGLQHQRGSPRSGTPVGCPEQHCRKGQGREHAGWHKIAT